MSNLSENLNAAKAAIRYLSQLKIRSNNRPHELAKWILKHPRSLGRTRDVGKLPDGTAVQSKGWKSAQVQFQGGVDGFLLSILRHENNPDLLQHVHGMNDQTSLKIRGRRKEITYILTGTGTTRDKRDQIKAKLAFWQQQDGQPWTAWCKGSHYWHGDKHTQVDGTTEYQSMPQRAEKKLTKFRYGNCGEKSAAAYQYLIRNNTGKRDVLWVSCKHWDHAYTVYGATAAGGTVQSWGPDAVIVDGWSEDYYAARHPYRFTSGNVPGPWQLWVRKQIVKHANALDVVNSHDGAGAPPPPPVEDDAEAMDVVTELTEILEEEFDAFVGQELGERGLYDSAKILMLEQREGSGSPSSVAT